MVNKLTTLTGLLTCVWLFTGCAPKRPVLYPNPQFQQAGAEAARQDIDDCLKLAADSGMKSNRGAKILGQSAAGAAQSAGTGAATGVITGGTGGGRGAAAAAAGGGIQALIRGLFGERGPDPALRRFVEQCLTQKGYQISDWQ